MNQNLKNKILKPEFMKKIYKFYLEVKNKVMTNESE